MRRALDPCILWLILAVSIFMGGCGALRAAGAKHEYIETQTQQFVYDKPVDEVWPQARQLLFGLGYEVKDTGSYTAETEWQFEEDDRTRYLVTASKAGDGRSRVQFMRAEGHLFDGEWTDYGAERDLGMEFELIKLVEPERARQIEAEAELEGERAREEG